MKPNNQSEITAILKKANWFLLAGVAVIVVMPSLLTSHFFHERFNFSQTGQIGDTIGGITAPFMNLIGAILVFYALKAQVKANELVQNQIDRDNQIRESDKEEENVRQLYSYLDANINNFHFVTLPTYLLRDANDENETEYVGGAAFYHLFTQIYCKYHGTMDELLEDPAVTEMLSILKLMEMVLLKVQKMEVNSGEVSYTLIRHLYLYKVTAKLRSIEDHKLEPFHCGHCNSQHGIPEPIRTLLLKLNKMVQDEEYKGS